MNKFSVNMGSGEATEAPLESEKQATIIARVGEIESIDSRSAERRVQVNELATGAVGKSIDDLNAAEIRALVFVNLERSGAIDNDLKIRPLDEWR